MLARAVENPWRPVAPHRPTELQVRDDSVGHYLKPWIERLGIACVLKDKLDVVEKVLFDEGEALFGKVYRLVPGADPIWLVNEDDGSCR